MAESFQTGDVVASLDDGQKFRIEIVLDCNGLLVEAIDRATAGETGIVLADEVHLVDHP